MCLCFEIVLLIEIIDLKELYEIELILFFFFLYIAPRRVEKVYRRSKSTGEIHVID